MVTLLIISTVHVRSFPYLRPPLPDSSLDESLLFCASAFWTIPWKCLKPDGIVKGNKCENLSLFYSLFFPCFFVQFFSNWQHSIIATRKFCWYYGVCDWPILANVIIYIICVNRTVVLHEKGHWIFPSISGLNLQGNADGGTVRSPPLHRGDSELPKSGSTIQGAPGETSTRQAKEVVGGKTPGRSIKFGGKTPRWNLKVFPGEFWLCSELWTQLHNLKTEDSAAPLTDANEHWRRELDDWRALLAPFSWKNSRAPVMSPLPSQKFGSGAGEVTTRYCNNTATFDIR